MLCSVLLTIVVAASLGIEQPVRAMSNVDDTLATAQALTLIYPLGLLGKTPGDGVYIRDSYAVENTGYNPGWLHTAEDWYALEGSCVGLPVYAVTDGEVVYAGANYPGRVVIISLAPITALSTRCIFTVARSQLSRPTVIPCWKGRE